MRVFFIRLLVINLSMCLAHTAQAQNEAAVGAAFEAGYKFKFRRGWAMGVGPAAELRPYFQADDKTAVAPPTLRNLDLNVAVVRRWLEDWRFGSAVRLRTRYPGSDEEARELRTWLYAERITDFNYFRWVHRFRTEQRFRGDRGEPLALTYRHRYRIGVERGLEGRRQSRGEWFFTATAEVLVSTAGFAERPNNIDLRPTFTVGRRDLEYGFEYRHSRDLGQDSKEVQRAYLLVMQWSL